MLILFEFAQMFCVSAVHDSGNPCSSRIIPPEKWAIIDGAVGSYIILGHIFLAIHRWRCVRWSERQVLTGLVLVGWVASVVWTAVGVFLVWNTGVICLSGTMWFSRALEAFVITDVVRTVLLALTLSLSVN
jgi:hypothetical protein